MQVRTERLEDLKSQLRGVLEGFAVLRLLQAVQDLPEPLVRLALRKILDSDTEKLEALLVDHRLVGHLGSRTYSELREAARRLRLRLQLLQDSLGLGQSLDTGSLVELLELIRDLHHDTLELLGFEYNKELLVVLPTTRMTMLVSSSHDQASIQSTGISLSVTLSSRPNTRPEKLYTMASELIQMIKESRVVSSSVDPENHQARIRLAHSAASVELLLGIMDIVRPPDISLLTLLVTVKLRESRLTRAGKLTAMLRLEESSSIL